MNPDEKVLLGILCVFWVLFLVMYKKKITSQVPFYHLLTQLFYTYFFMENMRIADEDNRGVWFTVAVAVVVVHLLGVILFKYVFKKKVPE